jgi:hypothetical protein
LWRPPPLQWAWPPHPLTRAPGAAAEPGTARVEQTTRAGGPATAAVGFLDEPHRPARSSHRHVVSQLNPSSRSASCVSNTHRAGSRRACWRRPRRVKAIHGSNVGGGSSRILDPHQADPLHPVGDDEGGSAVNGRTNGRADTPVGATARCAGVSAAMRTLAARRSAVQQSASATGPEQHEDADDVRWQLLLTAVGALKP